MQPGVHCDARSLIDPLRHFGRLDELTGRIFFGMEVGAAAKDCHSYLLLMVILQFPLQQKMSCEGQSGRKGALCVMLRSLPSRPLLLHQSKRLGMLAAQICGE